MNERFCRVGEIDLCYETFGDPGDPALLLIMGLGTQMVAWREELCLDLVDRGFHVIRFDNRDTGRSTHLRQHAPPSVLDLVTRRVRAAYGLTDMAADAVGLLDHLGIDRAHVVGASMGGMIAQTIAAEHPRRVLSLTSIMSTTGARRVGQPALAVIPLLLQRAPHDREAYAERTVRLFRRVGSGAAFPADDERVRDGAREMFDRGVSAASTGRQLAAILAGGDRTAALRTIRAPTLVIHGTADRLVATSGGRATAAAIPGARLELIEGMGHDLPVALYDRIAGLISAHARSAQAYPDTLGAPA